ncbi:MAG: 2-polyprenyl-3-methyl-6-methoxy-1,4-benzoquinone monooxygenase [Pseudomonadota bacterium]
MFDVNATIIGFDKALRVIAGIAPASRPNPGKAVEEAGLSDQERRHSAGLMRVNHVGEVCAQALYQSQSRRAQSPEVAKQFIIAGREEQDHLGWTGERLKELGARPSLLNPLWYVGSFCLGTAAARLGDATSLGFMVETERQVEAHLASHLDRLPVADAKSRAIVEQMRQDEASHGQHAQSLGAAEVPAVVRVAMRGMAKTMTTVAYYI